MTENAEKIRILGEEMYQRLATFSEHLSKVGRSLDTSVGHYNRAVGSFQSNLIPAASKFAEMGIKARKEIEIPEQSEKSARLMNEDPGQKSKG